MMECYDLTLLPKLARSELFPLLQSQQGQKSLVIEECLLKALDRIVSNSTLRQMDFSKIFRLESFDPSTCDDYSCCAHRYYLARPRLDSTRKVLDHCEHPNSKSLTTTILYWPRRTHLCLELIEQRGLYGQVRVEDFNPTFLTLAPDLISLEMPEVFAAAFLDRTFQGNHAVAFSLLRLKLLFGDFAAVYCLGPCSNAIYRLTQRMVANHEKTAISERRATSLGPPAADLFLLDRNADFVSVFLSSLTYESLVDEVFGIKCGYVDFGSDLAKLGNQNVKVLLDDKSDHIFATIKNCHFSYVMEQLKKENERLKSISEKRHLLGQNIAEMKSFVAKDLQKFKFDQRALLIHVGAFESIISKKHKSDFSTQLSFEAKIINNENYKQTIDFLEDLMCQQVPKIVPLSLLCLLSQTLDGLSLKDYNSLRRQFVQAYGHKHLCTFSKLEKAGLLLGRERANRVVGNAAFSSSKFEAMCRKLDLVPRKKVALGDMQDASYVFNGVYTPALCKLVHSVLGGKINLESLAPAFGPKISLTKDVMCGNALLESAKSPRTKLIYFVGGVTYAEISALRLINKVHFPEQNFVIAATHVINKEKLIASINPDL